MQELTRIDKDWQDWKTDHTYINDCRSAPWLLQCDISNFTHVFIDKNTEHKERIKGLLDSSAALFSPGKNKYTYLNARA